MTEHNKKQQAMNRIEMVEERLKFIEAQFGIEFVPPHEVGPSYRKIQQDGGNTDNSQLSEGSEEGEGESDE